MSGKRESRYKVASECRARAMLERPSGCIPAIVAGEFLDLSRGGAKLRLAVPVESGESVCIRVEDAKIDLRLSISAEVSWVRKLDGAWVLGCTFDPPLPDAALEDLFTKGLLERRRAPRHETRVPISARWECNPAGVPSAVDLVDLSPGGFCLRSALPAVIGSRMRLLGQQAGNELAEVAAKVRWQLEEHGGFLIGCEFNGAGGAARLHDWVACQDSQPRIYVRRSWVDNVRRRLAEFRRRPADFLGAWLGLNEHDKIMRGSAPTEPDAEPVEAGSPGAGF